ncbi:methyltransferase, partial [Oryctes borbonicus]
LLGAMLNEYIDEQVRSIQKQFLCCVSIKNISWNNFFAYATWNRQQVLIANTVDLDIVKRYPIKISYQVAFLKYLIDRLERLEDTEINDCIYDALGQLVSLTDAGKCYKHYYFNFNGKNKVIILEEALSIISEGTTGLCSWQASLALSEWCLRNRELFKNKTVLELGAGVGLTGLVISLNCDPKTYYFTDCHSVVLETLCKNIRLNFRNNFDSKLNSDISASELLLKINVENLCVNVVNLPWESVKTQTDK